MNRSFPIQLLLALFLTQGLSTRCQTPLFGIYSASGNIRCTASRGAPRVIVPHAFLLTGDRLTLLDNMSEITLFARDTSYIRLRGKGNYTLPDIDKMPHIPIRDTIMVEYFLFFWAAANQPASHGQPPSSSNPTLTAVPQSTSVIPVPHSTSVVPVPQSTSVILAPRPAYATSLDSLIFRWRPVSWARKYFLRLRNPDGQICYDSVTTDTSAIVYFPGRLPAGRTYDWALDIVGESGRLQFADSGHIVLVDESAILPQLPPLPEDSLGGISIILRRIRQYENAGCTKRAEALLQELMNGFLQDEALNKLYIAFRNRNYF